MKEMRALWLVEDCLISRYNHLARGDYGRDAIFQNSVNHYKRTFNYEENIEFGETLQKKDMNF